MSTLEIFNVILIVFIFLMAIGALRVRELVSAMFLLGAYSFFLAILWSLLAAADVSFTEAMVGVGASTIFLFLCLFRTRHTVKESSSLNPGGLFLILGLGVFLLWGSLDLPLFGDPGAAASQYLSPYYLKNAYHDMHTPNVVTAVVIDYRGFDTLIETTVIFTAGIACLLIMKEKI